MVSEKVRGTDLPQCVYDMYGRINHPHNFRAALAAGEHLILQYKFNQTGTPVVSVPKLCTYFDVGKTKLYEILQGGKFGKEEEVEKKPLKRLKPEPVKQEKEGPPTKVPKKEEKSHPHQRNPPPLQRRHQKLRPSPPLRKPQFFKNYPNTRSFSGLPHPPIEKLSEKLKHNQLILNTNDSLYKPTKNMTCKIKIQN